MFHGAGHVISHLFISDSIKSGQVTGTNAGLFSSIGGSNRRVDHLVLADVHVEGRSPGQSVGSIAGNVSGLIDSCSVSGGSVSYILSVSTLNTAGYVGGGWPDI